MLINRSRIMVLLAILCAPLAVTGVAAEDLATYATTCNKKVEVNVEKFDCLKGAEIPMDGVEGGDCKKPPYLDYAKCRKGSRFGVQTASAKTAVVWLCRKKSLQALADDEFDDIAVIQTNFENGATCFYQHLGKIKGTNVPAPKDDNVDFWMTPKKAAEQECASCHDSGLLRTPYLSQLTIGPNVLPKTRHGENYWFPGTDFAGWNGKVYKLSGASTTTCSKSGCHIMGANTIDPEVGTSSWLGLRATGEEKTDNLQGQHAFWMKPKLNAPDPVSKEASKKISECALEQKVVPGCVKTLWGGQIQAIIESQKGRTLPTLRRSPGTGEPEPQGKH